jgi:hypothetical protein
MTIPAFTAAGVLPPFVGDGGAQQSRSPYPVTQSDVVRRFGTSSARCNILAGWLDHRAALHGLGFKMGFQWIDGSFCEELQREPNDVDLVTFYELPPSIDLNKVVNANKTVFFPDQTKAQFQCDVYFVRLEATNFARIDLVHYWFGLFSHRKSDLAWKGILQVPLAPTDDAKAKVELKAARGRLP